MKRSVQKKSTTSASVMRPKNRQSVLINWTATLDPTVTPTVITHPIATVIITRRAKSQSGHRSQTEIQKMNLKAKRKESGNSLETRCRKSKIPCHLSSTFKANGAHPV
jgi:hypothetical protein